MNVHSFVPDRNNEFDETTPRNTKSRYRYFSTVREVRSFLDGLDDDTHVFFRRYGDGRPLLAVELEE